MVLITTFDVLIYTNVISFQKLVLAAIALIMSKMLINDIVKEKK
jgi:hypothetical protein